ncbi:MAG: hypothetical protein ACOH2E_05915 [Candidatus Paracaedibacter sp.]
MFHYFCTLLTMVVCINSRAADDWFEDCTMKPNKRECRKCCSDQYEIRVTPIQNRASIVRQEWIKLNNANSYCPESTRYPENKPVARAQEALPVKSYCEKLKLGINNDLWTMNQDDKNIYLEPRNKKELQEGNSNFPTSQTQAVSQPLALSIAEIKKNAEEEKRKCINRCEK